MLRVQLISKTSGSLVIDSKPGNSDPIGLNNLSQTIKRSDIGEGVVRNVITQLGFIELGKQFLEKIEAIDGPDTVCVINIFQLNDITRLFDIVFFTGDLNFNTVKKTEDAFYITADQTGFQKAVLNFLDKSIDVETTKSNLGTTIPAIAPQTLRLHSKRILYQFNGINPGDFVGINLPAGNYLTLDPSDITLNEIKTKNNVGINVSDTRPDPIWTMQEDGEYDFFIYVENNNAGGGLMNNVDVYYSINGAADVIFTRINDTAFRVGWTLNTTFNLKKGDSFRVYVKNHGGTDVFFNINTFTANPPLRFFISNLSSSAESTAKAFFSRDIVQQCVRVATGQNDCFKSNLLNRNELGGVDGDAALDFILNGHLIRKRDKQLFYTLKDITQTISKLYAASVGFEKDINNIERLVVEDLDYFFDKSSYSIDLGSVYNIEYKLNYDRLFNNFILAYSTQIDIGQVNAVDGFNTLRTYILSLINSENTVDYSDKILTDGFLIEFERRLIDSTADGRYDDKNFLIKGFRDAGYRAKKDDGYTSITNIIDPSSGYNYDLSPARVLLRWKKYLAANLIFKTNKTVKFASGSGNYSMVTTKAGENAVYENGDIDLMGIEPYTTPYDINFTCKTTDAKFKSIVESPYKYIKLSDLNNLEIQGFISKEGITFKQNQQEADYTLMQVYRK